MSRGEQLSRQWQVLRVLENHRYGISVDELSEKLECSRRTVERDLKALVEMGIPIQSQTGDYGKKFWNLTNQFTKSDDIILSPTEIISLYLANQLVNPLSGTYLGKGWEQFLAKIRSILPRTVFEHFSELEDTLYVKPSQHSKPVASEFLETIRRAIKDFKILKIDYCRDVRGNFSVTLHPYGLIVYENTFYIVGYSEEVQNIRTFKLQRIQSLELTKKCFQRPEDFSLEKCIKGSFGVFDSNKKKAITVRCELKEWAARTVREQKWHPTQVVEKEDGDTVIVSFLLHTTVEFIRWILGFGSLAQVLEPSDIREKVTIELQKTLDSYKNI